MTATCVCGAPIKRIDFGGTRVWVHVDHLRGESHLAEPAPNQEKDYIR